MPYIIIGYRRLGQQDYVEYITPGDGDCLFHSLSFLLARADHDHDPAALREKVRDFLEGIYTRDRTPALNDYRASLLNDIRHKLMSGVDYRGANTLRGYADAIAEGGGGGRRAAVWGDDTCIQILCEALNLRVVVHSDTGNSVFGPTDCIQQVLRPGVQAAPLLLELSNYDLRHFNALRQEAPDFVPPSLSPRFVEETPWDFKKKSGSPRFTGKDDLRNFVASQKEIRVFIPDSSGSGHQSTTVQVIQELISLGASLLRIIYAPGDEEQNAGRDELTWVKLVRLIPGLPARHTDVHVLDKATLFFHTTDDFENLPLAEIPLGVTGGWDDPQNPTEGFKVQWFLTLQPLQWSGVTGRSEAPNVLYGARKGSDVLLERGFEFGPSFVDRGLHVDVRPFQGPNWMSLPGEQFPPGVARCMEFIEGLRKTDRISLMPVYFSAGRPVASAADILFNLVAGLTTLRASGAKLKPVVIPVLAPLEEADYAGLKMRLDPAPLDAPVQVQTGRESSQHLNALDTAFPHRHHYLRQITALFTAFQQVRLVTNLPDYLVRGGLRDERSLPHILIVPFGRLPSLAFGRLMVLADLPSVFEGAGTMNLALNLGKPYLRLMSQEDIGKDFYPLPGQNAATWSRHCNNASSSLSESAAYWELLLNQSRVQQQPLPLMADRILANFFQELADPRSDTRRGFDLQAAFYGNPDNAKLRMGLRRLLQARAESLSKK
ncbi:OTU domain-containing protein [Corallococcus llansteffanensis]|uniref:OTU domain-containing protein n=1 Tax=Corallococcus llansteffanensis TaxID=2316731 RepID=A0A3A8QME4_9BACT|nr:OTU domain-containing protein [Corallococcus llansteffanensis]RKH68998.1 hypothetical protein D7V93_00295 [Corallococcus llansteffanensis]